MATRELNTKEAQAGFGIAHMTLYNFWNKGKDGDLLKTELKGGHRVFKLSDCERFAKKHGLTFKEPKAITLGSVGRKPAEAKKAAPAKKSAARVAVAKKPARKSSNTSIAKAIAGDKRARAEEKKAQAPAKKSVPKVKAKPAVKVPETPVAEASAAPV